MWKTNNVMVGTMDFSILGLRKMLIRLGKAVSEGVDELDVAATIKIARKIYPSDLGQPVLSALDIYFSYL